MSSEQDSKQILTRSKKPEVHYKLEGKEAVKITETVAIKSEPGPSQSPIEAEFRHNPTSSLLSSPPLSPVPLTTSTPLNSPNSPDNFFEAVAEELDNLHLVTPPVAVEPEPAVEIAAPEPEPVPEPAPESEPEMATAPEGSLPPTFTGLADLAPADWLREVARYAEYKELTDAKRLQLHKYLLRSAAADWLDLQPADTVDTNDKLIAAFKNRFGISDVQKFKTAQDIFTRKQSKHEPVEIFINEIQKLCKQIAVDDAVVRYAILNGMRPELAAYVIRQQPATIAEIIAAAKMAEATSFATSGEPQMSNMEAELRRLSEKIDRCTTSSVHQARSTSPIRPGTPPAPARRVAFSSPSPSRPTMSFNAPPNRNLQQQRQPSSSGCERCGLPFHKNPTCPALDPRNVCRGCGRKGHFLARCYSRQNQMGSPRNQFGNTRNQYGNSLRYGTNTQNRYDNPQTQTQYGSQFSNYNYGNNH